ncbi:MAG: peptidylprolyl isomerase [Bacteroidales bacterium]|nr:peptidylprolyl isomerase [Bacteroidales bacterium]MBR3412659.1 peptidylprolyl isomerase [Bacteroidales bacterium]
MRKVFLTLFFAASVLASVAQNANDPVIFEIGGKNFYKSQFMKEFLKSMGRDPQAAPTACTYEKRKALEDYVQLYVNFQTKLADAYALGYDTSQLLNNELAGYRRELAAPYLIDSTTLSNLLHEAYERNQYVLHAAHILVPCQENAVPADSLKAYNHAMELYQQALNAPNFYTVAQQEMRAQRLDNRDPLVREKANEINPTEGDLGCFTVFDMIYAFESAAYNMTPGQVSKPVRSRYGYHIIKLFDRYKFYGKSQVAHIWISNNTNKAEGKIKDAYSKLQSGIDFGVVAKNYSDDRSTADNGGIMPELAPNQLPADYVAQLANGLEVGEYTKPFHTQYGWHIIKLLRKETLPDFESMVPYYKSRMTRGERSTKPQKIFIQQCKDRYNFVDYTQVVTSKKKAKKVTYAADYKQVRAFVSDSIFSAIFHYDSNQITDMRPLFKIGDKEYNNRQFAWYIHKHKKVHQLCNIDSLVAEMYDGFISSKVLEYANNRLELDNEDFRNLIEDYRHGLMIFRYNDRIVWSKALQDTVGFERFYQEASTKHNINDTNDAVYFWNERARTHIYTVPDSTVLNRAKAMKVLKKAMKKGWESAQLIAALNDKSKKNNFVSDELQLLEEGNQSLLSSNEWREGMYIHDADSGYQIIVVEKMLAPCLKSRDEARGYYLNDYQNYLEEQNNLALRKKYNVIIHQDVIDDIVY